MAAKVFKVGDKIRCITPYQGWLIKDRIYTVEAINHFGNYLLQGVPSAWTPRRFELAETPETDQVLADKVRELYGDYLSALEELRGRGYEIKSFTGKANFKFSKTQEIII